MVDIVMRPSVVLASHAIQATLGSGEGIERGRRRRRLLRHRVASDGEAQHVSGPSSANVPTITLPPGTTARLSVAT
jgi:hypothetical protein